MKSALCPAVALDKLPTRCAQACGRTDVRGRSFAGPGPGPSRDRGSCRSAGFRRNLGFRRGLGYHRAPVIAGPLRAPGAGVRVSGRWRSPWQRADIMISRWQMSDRFERTWPAAAPGGLQGPPMRGTVAASAIPGRQDGD